MRFFFVIIVLLSFRLNAQIVNIENKRIYDDTSGWSGSLDANFSAMQNNEMLYNLGFRPRVQYKTRKHYVFFLSDVSYTGSSTKTYANSGMSHLRYAHRIKNGPWKWENYAQIQYNELLNQKVRALVGTGLRWKFFDKNNTRFFIGTSVFREYEELQTDKVINRSFRWSSYLSWFIAAKSNWSCSATHYIQPNIEDMKDVRYAGQLAFSMKLNRHLDLRLEGNLFHDSKPPINVRPTVFNTTIGIRVKLGE